MRWSQKKEIKIAEVILATIPIVIGATYKHEREQPSAMGSRLVELESLVSDIVIGSLLLPDTK
jgi:hypothetical protein